MLQKPKFSRKVEVEKISRKRNPKQKMESIGGKSNRKIEI